MVNRLNHFYLRIQRRNYIKQHVRYNEESWVLEAFQMSQVLSKLVDFDVKVGQREMVGWIKPIFIYLDNIHRMSKLPLIWTK